MKSEKHYYVYILTNRHNSVLYIGVTNSLERRLGHHILRVNEHSFTSKYKVNKLVYFEIYGNIGMALQREKRLKKWNRDWKIELIKKNNPEWRDLYFQASEEI
ncbi:GIY-YIG nuclease family protein [Candidatus Falkowbacteria bacterium]|nr:MAG: GIY-YIG nuclease family protein [Candidatus Falkowbacteria bacterium]